MPPPKPRRRRRGAPVPLARLLPPESRGRHDPVTRYEIGRALPPGGRRPRSRRELMRAFHADPRLGTVRADRAANLVATMQILARDASWADSDSDPRATTRPTREKVRRLAGYCISTWRACRAILQDWGWLRLLRQGRSEEARRKSSAAGLQYSGNDAAHFLLVIPRLPRWPAKKQPARAAAPASPLSCPPTPVGPPGTYPAREAVENAGQEPGETALRAGSPPTPAVRRALAAGPGAEKLTDRAVAAAWRPFAAALWTPPMWLYAVSHWPDGREHAADPSRMRFPAALLRWRLSLWLDPADGRPVLFADHAEAAARAAAHPERDRQRAEHTARDRTPGTSPTPDYQAARPRRRKGT